jgi:phytoene desaturase
MKRRVAVLGAGPGGLAVAMLLARAGASVTVFERRDRVGGRSGAIEADGFRFDMGPTFFLYPRVLEEIFAACGRSLPAEVEMTRLDPMYRLVFEGSGEMRAISDPERMAAEIARLCPRDALALPRFLAENREKLKAFLPILESPFSGLRDLLAPSVLSAFRWLRPHRSVDADLAAHFSDPRVRLAFSFQSKYLGMSPFQCPSLFTILAFLEYEYGIFHPRGGCSAIMEAMARVARDCGVDIRLGEAVEEIRFEGRRATAVRTHAGLHETDALVVNGDFAHVMATLVPDRLRRRWRNARLARKRFSCSTFMLHLGVEGVFDELDHHNILLAEDYGRNLRDIDEGRLPEQPSLYVQNACRTDPSLAPAGHSTLYVLVPVGNQAGTIDWARERPRYRRLVLDRLEKLGLSGLERRIRYERIVTPADWEADMHIYRGATFNLAHSLGQMLHRRPQNRFEDLEGVYLVGGGTHPGSGLPVIFESARITARLLAGDFGLAPVVPGPGPALRALRRAS